MAASASNGGFKISATKVRDWAFGRRLPWMNQFAGERPLRPTAATIPIEAGVDHEARNVEHLLSNLPRKSRAVLDAVQGPFGREARPLSFEKTVAAMRSGADWIVQGGMYADNWAGRPDLLQRVPGASVFGEWHYRALDYKYGRKAKLVHKLSVGYYALLLEKVQGRRPDDSSILLSDNSVVVVNTIELAPQVMAATDALAEMLGSGRDPGPFSPRRPAVRVGGLRGVVARRVTAGI